MCAPGSMNILFIDLFKEFWRGILGGALDYLGEMLGGFCKINQGNIEETIPGENKKDTKRDTMLKPLGRPNNLKII